MGIPLGGGNFTRGAAIPLDDSFVMADQTARDAINAGIRYDGMLVYVVSEQTMYQLQGGITNGDWYEAGGGGGGSLPVVDLATGDGVEDEFTLSVDPGTEENVAVYLDGVRQSTSEYSVSGTTLTFTTVPYNGATLMFVSGSVNLVNVPANGSVTQASKEIRSVGTTVGAGGIAKSATCGSYSYSSTSQQDITNLSVTITTLGNPVEIELIPDETDTEASVEAYCSSPGFPDARVYLYEGATYKGYIRIAASIPSGAVRVTLPPSIIKFAVHPPAGTYTYKFRASTGSGSTTTINITRCKMRAYEI